MIPGFGSFGLDAAGATGASSSGPITSVFDADLRFGSVNKGSKIPPFVWLIAGAAVVFFLVKK